MDVLSLLCTLVLAQQPNFAVWAGPIVDASAGLRAKVPVVDQVVFVPDLPTMLDELGRWSAVGHWPILIDGEPLNELFVRRFRPSRVLRRARVQGKDDKQAIEAAVGAAWDMAPGGQHGAVLGHVGAAPPGIVLTDEKATARAAAALLAAGRGQMLGWVEGDYGYSGGRLTAVQGRHLRSAVASACDATGAEWKALGDGIDTVTLCRDLAARVDGGGQAPMDNISNPPAVAVTDWIGRHDDGTRWAFAGWIFGTQGRSAYAANSSLFLPRTRVWMGDTYPRSEPWSVWKLDEPAKMLRSGGYDVTLVEDLDLNRLLAASRDGMQADLLFMTSKGNADFFRMSGGDDLDAAQVPVMRTPASLYMVHSWSLQAPYDARTVGGRWLANGVYADIGSSQEPTLQAFVPGRLVAARIMRGIPWLIAGRFWPGESGRFSKAWRINDIGDPLMMAPPPGRADRQRIAAPESMPDGCTNAAHDAATALRSAMNAPSDDAFASAIALAAQAGRADIAVQAWAGAVHAKVGGSRSAAAVLPSAVFQGNVTAAMEAAQMLGTLTTWQGDLIWALGATRLQTTSDPRLIDQMEAAIDKDQSAGRVRLLAEHMRRTKGPLAANVLIQRWLDKAGPSRQQAELKKLLKGSP